MADDWNKIKGAFSRNVGAATRVAGNHAAKAPGAFASGMKGTQGGPVDESDLMTAERIAQWLLSGAGGVASGVGMFAGGPTPAGAAGAAGLGAGVVGMDNAESPNIRDVWADQLRMKLQGRR